MQQTPDALLAWFRRVEPMCPELFNAAHAITGSYDLAEYALRSAILEVWLEDARGGAGLRERLRAALRREALELARSDAAKDAEFTWTGFPAGETADPLLRQAAQERLELQRLVTLRYGCGLSPRQAAQLVGLPVDRARAALTRFEARCRRNLSAQERARFDLLMARRARRALARAEGVPGAGYVYRALEAEASKLEQPRRRLSRVVCRVIIAVLALLCAAIFWLFAVIVQPVRVEPEPGAPAAVETAQPPDAVL